MNGGWKSCRWGDIATLEYGKALRGYESSSGSYCVYGTNGPIGRHTKALCNHPGVVIGRKGAYRGVHYSSEPFFVIDTAFYLEPHVKLDLRWAYYQLLTQDINGLDSGSAIPSTSRESFYSLRVFLPPLLEQRAIANILGTLDNKIELNRRMNETLESMARAIFKSWFVDFDPVRAKADGRQPAGMDAETAALFPKSFSSTALGEVPEGWGVAGLARFVDVSREGINPGEFPHETFDYYSIPAFDEGRAPKLETGETIKSNKLLVGAQTVLLSKLNPRIARVWLPDFSAKRRSVCSTEFIVAQPKQRFTREYVYCLFGSTAFSESFAQLVTGTSGSHQRVKHEDLLRMVSFVPPKELVSRFTRATGPLLRRVASGLRQSWTLASLRDTLLPKLLSGEIRIRDAEETVEKAL